MGNWFKDKIKGWLSDPAQGVTGFTPQGIDFFSYNGEVQWQRISNYCSYHRLLHKTSPLAAIFNKRANMFANGCVETLNFTSKKYVRGENKLWEKLINKPNPLQSKTAFLKQAHLYLDIFGWCYVMPVKPAGFKTPSKMWLLPPWMLTVELIEQDFWKIGDGEPVRRVWIEWNGERTEVNEKDLILLTDTSSLIDECTLLPEGRMRELEYPLTLSVSSYEALATLIQGRGPMAIISNDAKDQVGAIPMTPDEKDQVHEEFRSNYGLTRAQRQYIITSSSIKVSPISWNVTEMGVFDTLDTAKKDFCDVYNYPYELMSATKGVTFANKNEAKKLAYQDATIPESKSFFEQLNQGLKTEEANVEYVISYDDVEVLQESRKVKAEADLAQLTVLEKEYNLGTITLNDVLLKMGRDIKGEQPKTVDPAIVEDFNKYKFQKDIESEERTAKLMNNGQDRTA